MSAKNIKVLLIEDNPGDARLIREMLLEHTNIVFELVHADQLAKGLECLNSYGVDVILLDLGLPDSQGIDSLHAMLSRAHHIPIVIQTGLSDEALAVSAVKAGAQDYLIKGQITSPLLSRSIRYAIERKKMEEALKITEERVKARTVELSAANEQLEHELSLRKRTESMMQTRLRILETAYASGFTLYDTLRLVLDEVEAQTGSQIGFYHFLEEDQETLSLQYWSKNTLPTMGSAEEYNVSLADAWVDAIRERRPVIHNDYSVLPQRMGMPAGHAPIIRELVVPIFRGSTIVAIIGVGNKAADYNEDDVQVTEFFGDFSWEIVKRKRAEEALHRLTEELEQRVKERTAELGGKNDELERMNRLFVGRELRMAELKQRISELEKQLNTGDD